MPPDRDDLGAAEGQSRPVGVAFFASAGPKGYPDKPPALQRFHRHLRLPSLLTYVLLPSPPPYKTLWDQPHSRYTVQRRRSGLRWGPCEVLAR